MSNANNPPYESKSLILAIDNAFARSTETAKELPGRSDQEGWAVDELIDKLSNGDLRPDDVCYQHVDTVSFCSDPQYVRLLPALLKLCIRHWNQIDVMANNVVSTLIPPEPGSIDLARFEARIKRFTPGQRSAILQFLAWVTQQYGNEFIATDLQRAADWWLQAT